MYLTMNRKIKRNILESNTKIYTFVDTLRLEDDESALGRRNVTLGQICDINKL